MLSCATSSVEVVSCIGGGAALDGMPSSVAQLVCRRLARLYNCMNGRKAAVNACDLLTRRRAKRKALHCVDARQKKSPATLAGCDCYG